MLVKSRRARGYALEMIPVPATDGLRGACVLVTGGTGSLGQVLIRRLVEAGAREIRVAARRVPPQNTGQPPVSRDVSFVAADIGDADAMMSVVTGVDAIFHLAALKDISRCEADPLAAVQTNVIGSTNVVAAALREPRVRGLVAVSSDKACSPTSVLGMTKSLMERIVSRASAGGAHAYGSVRIGNIWGSGGSVLDRWRKSAVEDGHIDVTDARMTRFLLTHSEAVDVLVAAISRPFAGEVIAPLMRAYRVGDLADAFHQVHGVTIREIGRRPGEKVDEDLLSPEEALSSRREGSLYVVGAREVDVPAAPFSSANADRVSVGELRTLLRAEPT